MYMAQWDNQKLVSQGSLDCLHACFSLVFIKNLINDKSKHKNVIIYIVLYWGPSVIYNMYKSMTS